MEDGEISIQLKNQTNVLLFAHLEYVRRKNEKEFSPIWLDFDGRKPEAGFRPPLPPQ